MVSIGIRKDVIKMAILLAICPFFKQTTVSTYMKADIPNVNEPKYQRDIIDRELQKNDESRMLTIQGSFPKSMEGRE